MAEEVQRFEWVARTARGALIGVVVLLALAFLATVAITAWVTGGTHHWTVLVTGLLCAAAELVAAICAVVGYGLVKVMVSTESASASLAGRLDRVESLLVSQADSVRRLTELASLSDQAKSCIFREKELEAIRQTIHEDLMRQDYQTAEALIDTMEKRGYADEAARMREELGASRKATLEEKIDAAVRRIQDIIDRDDWSTAIRESQRLLRLFPENAKIAPLPERIEAARTKHKRDLLQAYGDAVKKNDLDQSIELLTKLDAYLTPQEAAALQDSARGVFRAKLHNLGVQFAISVTERQWARAIAVGEDIMREFPNTRMAQEVREKMDQLSARAGKPKEA
jgi:DNA-binding PadR family transcriptional regulator